MTNNSSRSQQLTKLNLALDRVVAVLVLCLGIMFMSVSVIENRLNGIILSSVPLISSLVYLILSKKLSLGARPFKLRLGNRIRSLSHVIFLVSLALSIWLLWSNLYYRPPLYFGLCLLAAASIIWDILILEETRNSPIAVVLFKIITLSITIYAGIYYEFPGIYGVDPWWHNQWIQETVSLGHITPGQFAENQYFLFPVFHLAAAIMHIITGLSIYSSVFITVAVLMVVSYIFVFLIGKKLVSAKAGLLAALIIPLTDVTIERASAIIPMSLGFCFFLALLYLIFCRDGKRLSDSLMIILLSVALIFTHTIASFIMLLSLIAVFIGTKLQKRISGSVISYEPVSLTLILFFGATMMFKWMQTSWDGTAFLDPQLSHLANSLLYEAEFAPTKPFASIVSPAVTNLNRGGYLLLLAFAIIGALIYLHPRKRTALIMALVMTVTVLLILPIGFELFGSEVILPERWYIFLYVPLSILAVKGLSGVSSLLKWNVGEMCMVMLVMLAIIFMMITNSLANDDSPLIFNKAERIGYTQSEITAITTLDDMDSACPITDVHYNCIFSYVIGFEKVKDMVQRENKVFILRNYYLQHPEWNQSYIARISLPTFTGADISLEAKPLLISEYVKEHTADKSTLIYINGNVKIYDFPTLGVEP